MFGRRRRQRHELVDGAFLDEEPAGGDEIIGEDAALAEGPYDAADAPVDDRPRLDLGSLRLLVPEGAQLQVEVDRGGPVRAVHLVVPQGQITVTAYAAPRSGGQWAEVARELAGQLRSDGARIGLHAGEWGREISAVTPDAVLRFLGVDGPRWMLRGVAAGSQAQADALAEALRDVVRATVVVRGPDPLPVRSALPLQLPEPLAEQLEQAAPQAKQGARAQPVARIKQRGRRPGTARP